MILVRITFASDTMCLTSCQMQDSIEGEEEETQSIIDTQYV